MSALSRGGRIVRRFGFPLIAVLVATELSSWLGLAALRYVAGIEIRRTRAIYAEQTERIRRLFESGDRDQHDAQLGWRYLSGFRSDRDVLNRDGLRSDREYELVAPAGVRRVAAFGDSFVYGNEVDNAGAWPAILEGMSPGLEVLNFGVGGYGTDQAYLRYQLEGKRFNPDVVLIGFFPDDLRRAVNVYRRFLSDREVPVVKPRFDLGPDGSLRLLPNPAADRSLYDRILREPTLVRALGNHDHWYQPVVYENPFYDWSATIRLLVWVWTTASDRFLDPDRLFDGPRFNPSSSAMAIQLAIFESFLREATQAGSKASILLLPDKESLRAAHRGGPTVYSPLVDSLAARGLNHADAAAAFLAHRADSLESWFMPGGHYSPAGNEIVACFIVRKVLAADEGSGEQAARCR